MIDYYKYLVLWGVLAFLTVLPLGVMPSAMAQADGDKNVFLFDNTEANSKLTENLEKGKVALSEKMFDAAEAYFEKYLELAGKDEPAYSSGVELLAEACIGGGNPQKAVDVIAERNKSTEQPMPTSMSYCLARALVKLERWSEAYAQGSKLNVQGIEDNLRTGAVILCADCLMKQVKWNEMEKLISEYLSENPRASQIYQLKYRMAEAQISQGKYDDASVTIDSLKNEARNSVDELKYKLIHVRNLALLKRKTEAMAEYSAMANQIPDYPDNDWYNMLTALADNMFEDRNFPEALNFYGLARKMAVNEQNQRRAMDYSLRVYILRKDDESIIRRALDEFAALFPNTSELFNLTDAAGRMFQENGKVPIAAEFFEKLAKFNPPQNMLYQAYVNAGKCWSKAADWMHAVTAYMNAFANGITSDNKAEALFNAASAEAQFLRNKSNDYELHLAGALEKFKKVADDFPKYAKAPEARFYQGQLLEGAGKNKEAAQIYGQFLSEFPENDRLEMAMLNCGACLRKGAVNSAEKIAAADFLVKCTAIMKDAELRGKAHVEAFRAYDDAGERTKAEQELAPVIDDNAISVELRKRALFARAVMLFDSGSSRLTDARRDLQRFEDAYPEDPLADHLYMYNGDSYAANGNWSSALSYYIRPVNKSRDEKIMPFALYEASNASFMLKENDRAVGYVNQLIDVLQNEKYSNSSSGQRLLEKAFYLKGDILSTDGNYDEAVSSYGKSFELASNVDHKGAAGVRCGEMFLLKGMKFKGTLQEAKMTDECFDKARSCFDEVIKTHDAVSHPIGLRAKYYRALSFKAQEKPDDAISAYKDFYISYANLKRKIETPDDFFFANAIFDLAELLENKGDRDSLCEARDFYAKLTDRYKEYIAERGKAGRPASAVDLLEIADTAEKRISNINNKIQAK